MKMQKLKEKVRNNCCITAKTKPNKNSSVCKYTKDHRKKLNNQMYRKNNAILRNGKKAIGLKKRQN